MYRSKNNAQTARTGEIATVGEALQDLLNAYQLRGKYEQTQLIQSWSRLMGPTVARRTHKLFVKDKVLFVKLSSAPLKQELNMSKSKILALFLQEFGEVIVEDVAFL